MEKNSLSDMITALEYGNQFHISVIMLNRCGNAKTRLPLHQRTHEIPICEAIKTDHKSYARCYRCREAVLRLATTRKKEFSGLCIHGVYEYCRPVLRENQVAAVIMIGNIYDGSAEQQRRLEKQNLLPMIPTMQHNYTREDYRRTADILESYISYLLDIYGERIPQTFDTAIEEIRHYIEENYHINFSIETLAKQYNYNEKYLGRLFKSRTGYSIREYCNIVRLRQAKKLLKTTKHSIAQIATQTGFNNVTYFNRVFKSSTQMSPVQYRQKKKSPQQK